MYCEFLISTSTNRWRRIINSPAVEEAVDGLSRAVVDEFITDLWYSSITPDQEAPEELRILLNGVIAEVAQRARRVNLTTLLSKYASVNHLSCAVVLNSIAILIIDGHTSIILWAVPIKYFFIAVPLLCEVRVFLAVNYLSTS